MINIIIQFILTCSYDTKILSKKNKTAQRSILRVFPSENLSSKTRKGKQKKEKNEEEKKREKIKKKKKKYK